RTTPHIGCLVLIALLGPALIQGCRAHPPPERKLMTIIVGETVLYQEPDRLSSKVATLTYGQQVLLLPKKYSNLSGYWTEVRLDKDRSGFVKSSTLGTPEMMATFQRLKESIEGMDPQASGVTTVPAYFRLVP